MCGNDSSSSSKFVNEIYINLPHYYPAFIGGEYMAVVICVELGHD